MKSSHLNVTKRLVNVIGSQMSMQSSVFGRLGMWPQSQDWLVYLTSTSHLGVSCQAWLIGELFLQCYAKQSPVEDVVHCICRSAFLVGLVSIVKRPDY